MDLIWSLGLIVGLLLALNHMAGGRASNVFRPVTGIVSNLVSMVVRSVLALFGSVLSIGAGSVKQPKLGCDENMPDALRHLKVMVLDLKLPKVSGLEVLEAVKSNDKTRDLPVVVLTSSQEEPDLKQCYKLGVNSFVVKPVGFEQFAKVIADLGLYWLVLNNTPQR